MAYTIIYIIEPLVFAFECLTGIGAAVEATLSTALLRGANFLERLFISVAISTVLTMFGEVLAAVIPHDDPVWSMVTATGATVLSIIALALNKYIMRATGLSKGDVLGISLAFLGFGVAFGGVKYPEYAHLMAVIGAGIAGVGLTIALFSPDLPRLSR